LVLLDDGWSCQEIGKAFLLDDDTIRGWRKLFEHRGIEGLTSFDVGGSASSLTAKQEDDLKAWAGAAPPRSTRQIGAWTRKEFGLVYESLARFAEGARRSGLIALSHRLCLEYHKPEVIPRNPKIKSLGGEAKQKAFIALYENLLNSLGPDEAVVFADAVHPPSVIAYHDHFAHAARPVGGPGAGQREARDRANKRASAHQHSRRD
jgi:transposase